MFSPWRVRGIASAKGHWSSWPRGGCHNGRTPHWPRHGVIHSTLSSWSIRRRNVVQGTRNSSSGSMSPTALKSRKTAFPCVIVVKGTQKAMEDSGSRAYADLMFLDMEDAVPMTAKVDTRAILKGAIENDLLQRQPHQRVCLRINSLQDHPDLAKADVQELVHTNLRYICLPKVESSRDISDHNTIVEAAEKMKDLPVGHTKYIVLGESARSYFTVGDMLSADSRIAGVILGKEDFVADTGGEASHDQALFQRLLVRFAIATRMHNIPCVNSPVMAIDDHNLLLAMSNRAKEAGINGGSALTPQQAPIIQQIFGDMAPLTRHDPELRALSSSESLETTSKAVHQTAMSARSISSSLRIGAVEQDIGERSVRPSWLVLWDTLLLNLSGLQSSERFGYSIPHGLHSLLAMTPMPHFCSDNQQHKHVLVGCTNSVVLKPLGVGDTYRTFVRIDSITPASEHIAVGCKSATGIVVETQHSLVNQHDRLCFRVRCVNHLPSTDALPGDIHGSQLKAPDISPHRVEAEKKTARELLTWSSQPDLKEGMVVHRRVRSFVSTDYSYLANFMHDSNGILHKNDNFSPAFILCAALSNVGVDVGEVAYDEILFSSFCRPVKPGNTLSAVSYIHEVRPLAKNPDLEEVFMTTIGLVDILPDDLVNCPIPLSLFVHHSLTSLDSVNKVCAAFCPFLLGHVAIIFTRRILRVKPSVQDRLQREANASLQGTAKEQEWFGA